MRDRGDIPQKPPGQRELRPFPAIDPEPEHRYSRRTAARAAIACAAACAAAAAAFAGVRLAGAEHPPQAAASSRFTDRDGLIVFEEQPSGRLGTASPDGTGPAAAAGVSPLQGIDLAVGAPDGRYLIDAEAELVTIGAHGPKSVTRVPPPVALAQTQGAGPEWARPTFADGSRYLAVTECDADSQNSGYEAWASWLIPTGGGKPESLGMVTASAGLPGSAAVVAALAADPAQQAHQVSCEGPGQADGSLDLLAPGKPPRVVATAAALARAAGWAPGTPVALGARPSPDGSLLFVTVVKDVAPAGPARPGQLEPEHVNLLLTRAGKVISPVRVPGAFGVAWSPTGRQAATCFAVQGRPSSVSVLTIAGTTPHTVTTRTIPLPGHRDALCDQLLWSPDGTQLVYSARTTFKGLTLADDLQHGWTVIDLRTGQVHDVTAPGQPAAWLPAQGRQ
jgi:hypothetical protein